MTHAVRNTSKNVAITTPEYSKHPREDDLTGVEEMGGGFMLTTLPDSPRMSSEKPVIRPLSTTGIAFASPTGIVSIA